MAVLRPASTTPAPGKLVLQGIVQVVGAGQGAAVGVEHGDRAAAVLNVVDHFHGGHVVDARVEADLVEEAEALGPDLGVQRLHLRLDVGGGDHVLAGLDAGVGHLQVVDPRQQRDHHVVLGHHLAEPVGFLHHPRHGPAVRMLIQQGGRLVECPRSHRHLDAVLEQVLDQRLRHQAGPEQQRFFHD
jgi:hypothetical protein